MTITLYYSIKKLNIAGRGKKELKLDARILSNGEAHSWHAQVPEFNL